MPQHHYQAAGEEAAPLTETQSLDFERVVNAYSIAKARAHLIATGVLEDDEDEKEEENGYQTLNNGHSRHGHEHHHPHHFHTPTGKVLTRWVLTILTGLFCGLVAILILFCVQKIGSFREERMNRQLQWATGHATEEEIEFYYSKTSVFDKYARHLKLGAVFAEYAIFNLVLALTSALMCLLFAPMAIGSGIPEVKAYLNGIRVPSFADANVFFAKIFATILAVSSGLIVGPEGPL